MSTFPILLTGFTGVLGKRFAYRLAALGYEVYCPVRAGSEAQARERFQSAFHVLHDLMPGFDASLERRIHPVPGDVRQKAFGLPASVVEDLTRRGLSSIWHLAALLDLTESNSQDVYETNLMGTLNVLEFARQLRVPELHYFSTFGSSGRLHEGIAREIPGIRPPSFRNTYERTKWEAERHVWQAQIHGEISATIYRPSIVVGDSVNGRYEQFNVFNHPFDVAGRVRRKLCEKQGLNPDTDTLRYELRVQGDGRATLNIVPLDWVLDTVMKLFAVPSSRGRVYHIVNENPPSLQLGMEIFKRHQPWEGLRWGLIPPEGPFLNPHEKFIMKQLSFLAPYLLGEATYDMSNAHAVLAFHGGVPELKNEIFLDAISRRGSKHGWQEVPPERLAAMMGGRREALESTFNWPEGEGLVVDFSSNHPLEHKSPEPYHYPLAERIIGKSYQLRERAAALFQIRRKENRVHGDRDLVLVPFGMGVTRRGEGEVNTYQHEKELSNEAFARMNQVLGFDLRAFAREPLHGHEELGDVHDDCCWATADNLIHVARLFRDVQLTGGTGLVPRLQVLPHSGGFYISGWLAGVVSLQDMALMAHQCSHLISEGERLASLREVEQWFFSENSQVSEDDRRMLDALRARLATHDQKSRDALARHLCGRLEMVFALNTQTLKALLIEVSGLGLAPAITLSPNCAVFAGNALQMARFHELMAGKSKLEFRSLALEVRGTPHFKRLAAAHQHAVALLERYDRQGRLRDPVVPIASYDGQRIRTRAEFIQSMASIADKPFDYGAMVEGALADGGRHFILLQSGMASAAGNLFDGIIHNAANRRVHAEVNIHRPTMQTRDPHAICRLLPTDATRCVPKAQDQTLEETLRWYERELAATQPAPR